jgi:hypothetical protein
MKEKKKKEIVKNKNEQKGVTNSDSIVNNPVKVIVPIPPLKMECILELAKGIHALARTINCSTQVIISNNIINSLDTGISIDTEDKG